MGKDFYRISPEQLTALQHYDWPGNIRELENCALYCKAMGELPQWVVAYERAPETGVGRDLPMAVLRAVTAGESAVAVLDESGFYRRFGRRDCA